MNSSVISRAATGPALAVTHVQAKIIRYIVPTLRRTPALVAGPVNLVSVLRKDFSLQIEGGSGEVGGAAEVTPIVLAGAEGKDFFALGGEAEIGRDDGKDAFFGEHGEKAGGDDVDAREGEGKWRVTSGEWRV